MCQYKNRAMKILNGKIFIVVLFEAHCLLAIETFGHGFSPRSWTPSLSELCSVAQRLSAPPIPCHADRLRMRDNGRIIKMTKTAEIVFIARVLM